MKPVDDTRCDTLRTEHHRHRGREIFAVAFANIEQEIRKRLFSTGLLLKRIAKIIP